MLSEGLHVKYECKTCFPYKTFVFSVALGVTSGAEIASLSKTHEFTPDL